MKNSNVKCADWNVDHGLAGMSCCGKSQFESARANKDRSYCASAADNNLASRIIHVLSTYELLFC